MPSYKKKSISINEIKETGKLEGDLYTQDQFEKLFNAGRIVDDKMLAELKNRHEKYYLIITMNNDRPFLVDKDFYEESMDFLTEFFYEIRESEKITMDAYQFIKNQANLLKNDMAIKMMEPYQLNLYDVSQDINKWVLNHTINTVILITYYAIINDMNEQDSHNLIEAAWLHDIGHALTNPIILNADHKLKEEELLPAMAHPHKAYEILKDINVSDEVRQGVLFHHENFDENGFPTTLPYARLPMPPKIIAMASVFENLYSAKPFRDGLGTNAALSIFFSYANTRFDYDLAVRFIRPLIKAFHHDGYFYIPGQFAISNFGEICMIRDYTRDVLKPMIDVITDAKNKIRSKPLGVDLTNDYTRTLGKIYSIEESKLIREKLNLE